MATLARKLGSTAVIVDDAATDSAVISEVNSIDAKLGGGGAAEAVRISFLSEYPENDDIRTVEADALVGQCTLISYRSQGAAEFETSFVYDAHFSTPSLEGSGTLPNHFINCGSEFQIDVRGRTFHLTGLYFAQQNGITSACAHASVRMVAETLSPNSSQLTTQTINDRIEDELATEGLFPDQIVNLLEESEGCVVSEFDCTGIPPQDYVSVLAAAVDSGDIALLVFKTGNRHDDESEADRASEPPANHVVVVYGYIRNTDEWHPLAIPEYSGSPSAPYYPSSGWVDHFVIHDDNFGPYLTLSTQSLEADPAVYAERILIVRRRKTNVHANVAEAATAMTISAALPVLTEDAEYNQWLNFLVRYQKPLTTRPVLLTREQYARHLQNAVAHDGTQFENEDLASIVGNLPDDIWMVEFSPPDLFTGNHSKLGEVLFESEIEPGTTLSERNVRGIRLPSRFIASQRQGKDGKNESSLGANGRELRDFPIQSHFPIFEFQPNRLKW